MIHLNLILYRNEDDQSRPDTDMFVWEGRIK